MRSLNNGYAIGVPSLQNDYLARRRGVRLEKTLVAAQQKRVFNRLSRQL
jgi:hypothetical protein